MASTNWFLTWFSEWGQVVIYLTQILYWIAVGAAALIAALQFKRYVSVKAEKYAAKLAKSEDASDPAHGVSVEEFVE